VSRARCYISVRNALAAHRSTTSPTQPALGLRTLLNSISLLHTFRLSYQSTGAARTMITLTTVKVPAIRNTLQVNFNIIIISCPERGRKIYEFNATLVYYVVNAVCIGLFIEFRKRYIRLYRYSARTGVKYSYRQVCTNK
jgi:hypothetical protein